MNRLDIATEHLAVVQAVLQKNVPLYTVWAFGSRVIRNGKALFGFGFGGGRKYSFIVGGAGRTGR